RRLRATAMLSVTINDPANVAWTRGARLDSRGARGLAGRAWTRGARLDSRGALGLAGRAWTRGARLDSRGAPGLAGRAWTRGARLDSRGAPGLARRAWTRGARGDSVASRVGLALPQVLVHRVAIVECGEAERADAPLPSRPRRQRPDRTACNPLCGRANRRRSQHGDPE